MRDRLTRLFAFPTLILALCALLFLAVLQFIWIGQLSQNAYERMQANATSSAAKLSEEFDRELARAYLDLQMDALTLRDQHWSNYRQRYELWRQSALYPEMVQAIYVVEIGRNGTFDLRAYDPKHGDFYPRTWTSEFAGLLRSFDKTYRTRRIDGELIVGNSPPPIEESLPALVIPVSRPWMLGSPPANEPELLDADLTIGGSIFNRTRRPCLNCEQEGPLFAYTIIHLDRAAIATTVLPGLAQRHLGSGQNDYYLTIVDRYSNLIYHSDTETPALTTPADATAQLLTLRLDQVNRLVVNLDRRALATGVPDSDGRFQIAIGLTNTNQAGIDQNAQPAGWQLRLTHRAGSLDAAVANLRTRNLLISFGSILLLGTALVMLVVSTRRAQRLARRKVEFVAAVSHELRTPLSVICSAGANLADGVVADPERARQYGALITREGRRLTEMVEQAVAFAAAQNEGAPPERQLVEPRELVERALAHYRTQFDDLGLTLEFSVEPNLPHLIVDYAALQRAIHNLIGNALKYADSGGWLRVSVATEGRDRRAELLISVADHGPGIPPADLPYIFEPFYRGSRAINSQIHGSGLGLSLVKTAAEAHGGRVLVENQPGQGCTFVIRLPIHDHQRGPVRKAVGHPLPSER